MKIYILPRQTKKEKTWQQVVWKNYNKSTTEYLIYHMCKKFNRKENSPSCLKNGEIECPYCNKKVPSFLLLATNLGVTIK